MNEQTWILSSEFVQLTLIKLKRQQTQLTLLANQLAG